MVYKCIVYLGDNEIRLSIRFVYSWKEYIYMFVNYHLDSIRS